jgi:glucan phosphoethanolaminetransferase (alkaline phosphatase superfamily)
MADREDRRVQNLGYALASDTRAWHRVTVEGLPRWASVALVVVTVIVVGAAISVYYATRSGIAVGVFAMVGAFVDTGIVQAAQLTRQGKR